MFKYKNHILVILMLFFLALSFYPTLFEIKLSGSLYDKNRQFILEHNYYWPDFNLYLSKIRQGYENRWLAVEKYTSEKHTGSLIQVFYLYLGKLGSMLNIDPNYAYQLGRIILSPVLLTVILLLVTFYFHRTAWQVLAFITIMISGSFPNITFSNGEFHLSRYMEWWSNIDTIQRITFIPHIIFGQAASFFLLYKLAINRQQITKNKLLFYILLGNLTGLVFPPSLITLIGVSIFLSLFHYLKTKKINYSVICYLLFVICSLPSLIYLFVITKQIPWSALVDFHRTHPMMVPLDQYLLGTGPVIILGGLGSLLAIINRKKQFYPLILWVVTTFLFASLFSFVKEQSPLRFTQTGLFIPLGILGTYFFYQLLKLNHLRSLSCLLVFLYLLENLVIMQNSLNWQLSFISQRVGADRPPVPYPPQTLYPLKEWMDAIRWLTDNTEKENVVLAEITAGNFIPAYAGNFVYFGQSNTVDYDRKLGEIDSFFRGKMSENQAQLLLKNGRIKYVFIGPQEQEKLGGKKPEELYPFLKKVFNNSLVNIYKPTSDQTLSGDLNIRDPILKTSLPAKTASFQSPLIPIEAKR